MRTNKNRHLHLLAARELEKSFAVEWSTRVRGNGIKYRRRGHFDTTAASTGNVKVMAPPGLWSAPLRSGKACSARASTATLDERRIGLATAQGEPEAFVIGANIPAAIGTAPAYSIPRRRRAYSVVPTGFDILKPSDFEAGIFSASPVLGLNRIDDFLCLGLGNVIGFGDGVYEFCRIQLNVLQCVSQKCRRRIAAHRRAARVT